MRCGGQSRGRVSRLERTVRWGSPRCSNWRLGVRSKLFPPNCQFLILHSQFIEINQGFLNLEGCFSES